MSQFFVVLEGLDGSGKSAIGARLAEHLAEACGADRVLYSFEPHDPSAAGAFIRDVLAKRIASTPRTLALAFALNRMDHRERVLGPFLASGAERVVICDRYLLSSLVYQGTATPSLSIEEVAALNAAAPLPDVTLFMDAAPDVCYARMGERGGQRELFEERLAEVRARYLFAIAWWQRERGAYVSTVDANGPIDAVFAQVCAALAAAPGCPAWLAACL